MRQKLQAVVLMVAAVVAMAVVAAVLFPRVARGQGSIGSPLAQPTTQTNIFGNQTLSYSNTIALAPVPSGWNAVRRNVAFLGGQTGNIGLSPSNFNAGSGATITPSMGTYATLSNGDVTAGDWIELARTPYYDASSINAFASGAVTTVRYWITAIPGGGTTNIPTGATGTTSFAVPQ